MEAEGRALMEGPTWLAAARLEEGIPKLPLAREGLLVKIYGGYTQTDTHVSRIYIYRERERWTDIYV